MLTKVFIQEGEGSEVAAKTDKFSYDHEPVPSADRQRHHQQLRQDQSSEGDRHHMHKLLIEQHQGPVHQDAPWWTNSENVWDEPTRTEIDGQFSAIMSINTCAWDTLVANKLNGNN